jgi:hypothetical protein
MSMIDRYKKKGGFIQLLNLMETCGPQKQEKFLKIIEEEDMNWGEAVKTKMLSIKRIFSWDDNSVAEIAGTLNDMTISIASFGLEPDQKEKMFKMIPQSRKRKIQDDITDRKPDAAEISTAFVQVITHVRKMISDGFIMLDKIDSELVINAEFEDKLLKGGTHSAGVKPSTVDVASIQETKDAEGLRKKLLELKSENDALREKLVQVEGRLAQIRKIA